MTSKAMTTIGKMSTAYQKEICLHQTSFKSLYNNIGSLKLTRNQVVNLSQVRLPYDQNQHEHKKHVRVPQKIIEEKNAGRLMHATRFTYYKMSSQLSRLN